MEPQPDHVQETVRRSHWEAIVITFAAAVGVAATALCLGCLMGTVWSRFHKKNPYRPCLIVIAIYPVVALSIWTVLGVALCLQNQRAGMQPPQEPITSSSSSSSFGGFWPGGWPGGYVPSAAVLQVGEESHQQRSEREREVEMSGEAAAPDLQVGEESHQQRSEREREVEMSGEAVSDGRGQNA